MIGQKSAFARGRASVFAGGLLATSALAGFGGTIGALVTPAMALAQCVPGPAPSNPPTLTSTGATSEVCTGGFSGLGYRETGPNLTVQIIGPGTITGGGVEIANSGVAPGANLTLQLGNATLAGQNINSTGNGIVLVSSGGNISLTTVNLALPGEVISANSEGIVALTQGGGSATIDTIANVTAGVAAGVDAQTVDGASTVTFGGHVGGPVTGVLALALGNGTATVNLGNATTGTGNATVVTPYSINVTGGSGAVAENIFATGNQTAVLNVTDPGNVTVTGSTSQIGMAPRP